MEVLIQCSYFVMVFFTLHVIKFCTNRETEINLTISKVMVILTCAFDSFSSRSLKGSSAPGHSPGAPTAHLRTADRLLPGTILVVNFLVDAIHDMLPGRWKTCP